MFAIQTRALVCLLFLLETFAENRERNERQLKKILLWDYHRNEIKFNIGLGRKPFDDNHCEVRRCYLASDTSTFRVEEFDAIVFNKPNFNCISFKRLAFQKYVYFSKDPPYSDGIEIELDGVFNLTMTYRLDSDVPMPYFAMSDAYGITTSPSGSPLWIEQTPVDIYDYRRIVEKKMKMVAWIVSECHAYNRRNEFITELQKNIIVDIYGECSNKTTPRYLKDLGEDYFFYLAFDNAHCKDYVTDIITIAFEGNAVPVVYGGADYSKFLPPGSYIDASRMTPADLASLMFDLLANPEKYGQYLWWKKYYKQVEVVNPFCTLCQILNENNMKPKVHDNFTTWWKGTYASPACKNNTTDFLKTYF